jgi:alpha,alpha-trehalase
MHIILSLFLLVLNSHAGELQDLLREEDTDKDQKITILDKGDRVFKHHGMTIRGHYALSNLLQELTLGNKITAEKIDENPVDRVSRMIREYYWDGLTRKIEVKNLSEVLPDTKVKQKNYPLYVPAADKEALAEFPQALKLTTFDVPEGKHGLLYLPFSYVVPGGRFNEMYGWDSYFESVGLMLDGKEDLVVSMIKNFTYQIMNYGKILNANRTYYLNRSQPPFFTSMIRLALKDKKKAEWLSAAVTAAIKEYETVWMGPDRLTKTGLSRYHGKGRGIPPEVEPGHFQSVMGIDVKKLSPKEREKFFEHDACVRESGHDTTFRFRHEGKEACADFVTVDLNTLLYQVELDLAFLTRGKQSLAFQARAEKRKTLMMKYLWNEKDGYFFDYHVPSGKQSRYISATGLYPLSIRGEKLLTDKQGKRVIAFALKNLEGPGGIYATAKSSRESAADLHERQWEWPNGWAPHQMIAWQGLKNYGHDADAERLISKWISMIAENARDYNGTIPEKYDVLRRSHAVFAEYGNVGTEFSYITREGFGWMNASFQYGLSLLSPAGKEAIKKSVK